MKHPCPIPDCPGEIVSKRVEGLGAVMGCTGPESHGDATIRNAIARSVDFLEDDSDAMLMRLDPVEFIRDQVKRATDRRGGGIVPTPQSMLIRPPSYSTGLRGVQNGRLLHYRGMTILSGKASSGKTWSAIRASLDAAIDGWHVHYLAAEGAAVAHSRAEDMLSETPQRWALRIIEDGSKLEDLTSYVADSICSERTLLVFDSISTVLRMLDDDSGEPWAMQRRLERFLFNLSQYTAGCVSPLVISEANAQGETKGRSFDHLADLAVNFRADEDEHEIKHVRVTKSWWDRTGDAGRFRVSVNQGGLVRLPDVDTPMSEQRGYDYAARGGVLMGLGGSAIRIGIEPPAVLAPPRPLCGWPFSRPTRGVNRNAQQRAGIRISKRKA